MSYPFVGHAPIAETIPEDAQGAFIGIMAEGTSAMLTDGVWLGGLQELSGTEGYWFITNEAVSFTYNPPVEGMARMVSPVRDVPSEYRYKQSMQQAFYFVENVTIGGEPLENEDLIIAYNGNVIIGSRYWYGETTDIPAMGADADPKYAGYGKSGDHITFKVLDASTNTLVDMDVEGSTTWENFGMSVIQLTEKIIPKEISISNAYPNPFNPATMISFGVPSEMEVHVTIHDMLGREIAELANGVYSIGNYELQWNANEQASGIYFVKMSAGGQTNIQKLMLIK